MSTYLITGGAGFIGSHLADRLLADGHAVRVLDDLSTGRRDNLDPRCALVVGDVADAALLRGMMDGVAGCFHLAAIASVARGNEAWLATHRVNQTGTVAVLEAARDRGRIPVVVASSAAVYGDLGDRVAAEDLPTRPLTAYGADKLGSELHARVAQSVHRVPTLALRFFNVYGPRQDPASPYSGVISIFARRIAAGQPVVVHGSGGQTRDFVFVADVVAHLAAGMARLDRQAALPPVLNVCTGRETSVLALARLLSELSGRTADLTAGPGRAGDIARSVGDPAAAVAALGLRALVPLADGLAATLSQFTDPAHAEVPGAVS